VSENERLFWLAVRQGILMLVDAIERYKLDMEQRTAQLRREVKDRQPDRS